MSDGLVSWISLSLSLSLRPEWSPAKDSGVRFDLCNITIQPEIKKTRCDFWHDTVDTYWEIEKWCVVGSLV